MAEAVVVAVVAKETGSVRRRTAETATLAGERSAIVARPTDHRVLAVAHQVCHLLMLPIQTADVRGVIR